MSDNQRIDRELEKLFSLFLKTNDENSLINYLVKKSTSSSEKSNLDLARQFIYLIEKYGAKDSKNLWKLALKMAQFPIEKTPSKESFEFLTFVGTWSLGLIAGLNPKNIDLAVPMITKILENSESSQIIEGASEGLNEIFKRGEGKFHELKDFSKDVLDKLDFSSKMDHSKNKMKGLLQKYKKKENDEKEE